MTFSQFKLSDCFVFLFLHFYFYFSVFSLVEDTFISTFNKISIFFHLLTPLFSAANGNVILELQHLPFCFLCVSYCNQEYNIVEPRNDHMHVFYVYCVCFQRNILEKLFINTISLHAKFFVYKFTLIKRSGILGNQII